MNMSPPPINNLPPPLAFKILASQFYVDGRSNLLSLLNLGKIAVLMFFCCFNVVIDFLSLLVNIFNFWDSYRPTVFKVAYDVSITNNTGSIMGNMSNGVQTYYFTNKLQH